MLKAMQVKGKGYTAATVAAAAAAAAVAPSEPVSASSVAASCDI